MSDNTRSKSDQTSTDQASAAQRLVADPDLVPGDTYQEGPYTVFTAQYHLRRGYCCNSDCRHCPYK